MARKRAVILRKAALVEAARTVLEHREAARRYDSALRKLRKAARPYAEKGQNRLRVGPAVVELEWKGGQKTVVPAEVKAKYTEFDERARLEMRLKGLEPTSNDRH